MFKKLEEDKVPAAEAAQTTAGECVCTCKQEKTGNEEETPAVDQAALAAAVYFEING